MTCHRITLTTLTRSAHGWAVCQCSFRAIWYDVEGSLLEASTASLSGWGSFFPAGGELTVYVALDDGNNIYDHFDTFDCP